MKKTTLQKAAMLTMMVSAAMVMSTQGESSSRCANADPYCMDVFDQTVGVTASESQYGGLSVTSSYAGSGGSNSGGGGGGGSATSPSDVKNKECWVPDPNNAGNMVASLCSDNDLIAGNNSVTVTAPDPYPWMAPGEILGAGPILMGTVTPGGNAVRAITAAVAAFNQWWTLNSAAGRIMDINNAAQAIVAGVKYQGKDLYALANQVTNGIRGGDATFVQDVIAEANRLLGMP
jgi:hypothetical protein